ADTKRRNQLVDREPCRSNRPKTKSLTPPHQALVGRHLDEQGVGCRQVAVAPSRSIGLRSSLEGDTQRNGFDIGDDHFRGSLRCSQSLLPCSRPLGGGTWNSSTTDRVEGGLVLM